jgi:hypothetical protein
MMRAEHHLPFRHIGNKTSSTRACSREHAFPAVDVHQRSPPPLMWINTSATHHWWCESKRPCATHRWWCESKRACATHRWWCESKERALPTHRWCESKEPSYLLLLPTIDVNRTRATHRRCEHQRSPLVPTIWFTSRVEMPPRPSPPPRPKSATSRWQPVPTRKKEKVPKKVLQKGTFGEDRGDSCLGLVSKRVRSWGGEAWVFPLQTLHLSLPHWWVFKSQSFPIGGFAIGGFKQLPVLPLVALHKWWFCHWWL